MQPPQNLPSTEFQARVQKARKMCQRLKLDALFVFTDINRFYLTGLQASNGCLLITQESDPVFYTDFRYLVMAKKTASWLKIAPLWTLTDEAKFLGQIGQKWLRVGYEGTLSATRFLQLQAAMPRVEWHNSATDLAWLRAVKSKAEQQKMGAAIEANDRLFNELTTRIAPGMTEWDIRCEVRALADLLGEGEAFDTIACVGRNGAECHHHPDTTVLRNNQALLLDLGLKKDYYCADMTRCLHYGTPPATWREIYQIVLEANQAAIAAIAPGVACCEIDQVARNIIKKAGYGDKFGHGLGHGIGLEVHEAPRFAANCQTPLKPGMLLTVEPGIYLPGRLGVRIEDVVLVTRDGYEVLTQTPKALASALR